MLWRRSANLIIRTRRSLESATSIFRMLAACCSSLVSKWSRSSLVTPSTISRTSEPKSRSRSSRLTGVSSTASWRRAAATVVSSSPWRATMVATDIGWLMYGSPDLRVCPACAARATWYARSMSEVSAPTCRFRNSVSSVEVSSTVGLGRRRQGRTRVTVTMTRTPSGRYRHHVSDGPRGPVGWSGPSRGPSGTGRPHRATPASSNDSRHDRSSGAPDPVSASSYGGGVAPHQHRVRRSSDGASPGHRSGWSAVPPGCRIRPPPGGR